MPYKKVVALHIAKSYATYLYKNYKQIET